MSSIKVSSPKVNTTINIRQRKNVLYQVTYELLYLFHAPHMKTVGRTLYAGLVDTQAIDSVTLAYLGKDRSIEFFIKLCYNWDTYEVLINTSRKDVEIEARVNSIDQFIGRKHAFQTIYKTILSTTSIYSKEVTYKINPNREFALERIVGEFHTVVDRKYDSRLFREVIYSSKELEELKVSLHMKKTLAKPSLFKLVFNKLRGI